MRLTSQGLQGSAGLTHTLAEGQLLDWGAPVPPDVSGEFFSLGLGPDPHRVYI